MPRASGIVIDAFALVIDASGIGLSGESFVFAPPIVAPGASGTSIGAESVALSASSRMLAAFVTSDVALGIVPRRLVIALDALSIEPNAESTMPSGSLSRLTCDRASGLYLPHRAPRSSCLRPSARDRTLRERMPSEPPPFEPKYKTLVDVYDHSINAYAARPIFGTKTDGRWIWITYGEFGSLVERFRGGLASLGVERGDRVAIISNNRVEWAVAAYACFGLGAALVPMYEAQNPKDWEFIARDCETKVLLVAREPILAKAKSLLDVTPSLEKIVLIEGTANGAARVATYASLLATGHAAPSIHPAPDDPATLLYTSGTTGNPKGVVLTHRNIASNVSAMQAIFPTRNSDRSLSFLPWAHAFGQTGELHCEFSIGASMAICEGVDKILDNLAEVQPTLLLSVPSIFNRLYMAVQQQLAQRPVPVQRLVAQALLARAKERAGQRLALHERAIVKLVDKLVFEKVRARLGGKLRYAVSGGAALAREVAEFIDSIGILIFEGYGLTETSPIASVNTPAARKIGSVGRPLPGVRVEIVPAGADHADATSGVPARSEGEIVISGPNVMKGYFNRPEETAAVFTPDGGFRTGDMGYLDADGFLFITGRIKEQYKLENGKYVVPSPLEEQLKLSPYVANLMVYGDNRPYNVVLIVPNVDALKKWAEAKHLTLPRSVDDLSKDERVRELFSTEIKSHSAAFKGFERIVDFALLPGDFGIDNGMLTPKLSLKRRKVLEVYGALIDQLYRGSKSEERAVARPAQS
ncbi:MAG: long-chain fatty acid--CoA ligase [Myxococcota bacterium]|nr:long-chain fatty acid--CoA ligase [Myxococcota bacterium]